MLESKIITRSLFQQSLRIRKFGHSNQWLILVVLFIIVGCSEQRSVSTLPPTHPAEWINPTADDFHGKVVTERGSVSCKKCHGENFDGGDSDISCVDCHLASGVCIACHGGTDNLTAAPPLGLEGESSRSNTAVGAHSSHVEEGLYTAAYDCEICHIKPTQIFDPGHIDNDDGQAEINLTAFAGPLAVYNQANENCENIYCHGSFAGGSGFTPVWTDSLQTECGSCHDVGAQPSLLGWKHAFHVGTAGIRCSKCHGRVVDDQNQIADLNLHINGIYDTLTTDQDLCDACHGTGTSCIGCHGGSDNQTGAPPTGLEGETLFSALAVGAHTAHVDGNLISDGVECSECHSIPNAILAIGHLGDDHIAEINFGSLAGGSSVWNRSNETCEQTYCHGNFSGGYLSNNPIWTQINQADCGSCHPVTTDLKQLSGKHEDHVVDEGFGCYNCHSNVTDNNQSIIGLSEHINGLVEISFASGQGNFDGSSCSNVGCHDQEDW